MERKKEAKSQAQMREIHINAKDPESVRIGFEQLKEDLLEMTDEFFNERFKRK